jgi:hypothetical protein
MLEADRWWRDSTIEDLEPIVKDLQNDQLTSLHARMRSVNEEIERTLPASRDKRGAEIALRVTTQKRKLVGREITKRQRATRRDKIDAELDRVHDLVEEGRLGEAINRLVDTVRRKVGKDHVF